MERLKQRLLMVPGIDGTGQLFYRQIPNLERRFAVATTRLRDDAASMEDLIDDLHAEIVRAAPDSTPVTLIGESFGGALSLSYALAHPERVERLVILNSFAHVESPARVWLAYHLLRATPWPMMRVVRKLNAGRMHSPGTDRREIDRVLDLMRATTRAGYLSRLRILRSYDLRERLAGLASPVLYLAADRDTLVPAVQQAQLMRALTPGASMRILEGHGHSCLIAPDLDLSAIIDDWLAGGTSSFAHGASADES
jgi:3-oxoadipate enol-lactonase